MFIDFREGEERQGDGQISICHFTYLHIHWLLLFLLRFYLLTFREREKEGEKEGEKH